MARKIQTVKCPVFFPMPWRCFCPVLLRDRPSYLRKLGCMRHLGGKLATSTNAWTLPKEYLYSSIASVLRSIYLKQLTHKWNRGHNDRYACENCRPNRVPKSLEHLRRKQRQHCSHDISYGYMRQPCSEIADSVARRLTQ